MTGQAGHYLERKSQPTRAGDIAAIRLRGAMEDGGLTAKELAQAVRAETPYSLDYRTVQNAMAGSWSLDTFAILTAFFGWDFNDEIMTPIIGASRIASLEMEIQHERARINAREAELARLRAGARARGATHSGVLRLVAEEDRPWGP